MAGNGPPPSPNAKRRNARVGMTRLPASGRKGPAPKWPLPADPRRSALIQLEQDAIEDLEQREIDEGGLSRNEATKLTRARQRLAIAEAEQAAIAEIEKELWRDLWRTPQACEWARLKWTREVAQYVRHKAAAEIGSLEESKEARLRAEALGLTPKGLRSLMWVIDHDEVAERRGERKTQETGSRRLRAVEGG